MILNNLQYLFPIIIISFGVWMDRGLKGLAAFWLIVWGALMMVEHVIVRVH